MSRVVLVVAVADNDVIGHRGALPWYLPEDLSRFARLTKPGTLIMGSATFESIGRPLPGRETVVLTSDRNWDQIGTWTAHSLPEAIELAKGFDQDIFVVGGASVYAEALAAGVVDRCEITWVHQEPEGDTFFPEFDFQAWTPTEQVDHDGYSFVTYDRRR